MITFSMLSATERRACLDKLDFLYIFRLPAGHPHTDAQRRIIGAHARLKDYCCGVNDPTVPRDRQQRSDWDWYEDLRAAPPSGSTSPTTRFMSSPLLNSPDSSTNATTL